MATTPARGRDQAERLEIFYRHQAQGFDDFRRRLLHGREELMHNLDLPEGGRLLDMGGGTGSNLEYLGERLQKLHSAILVDLCRPLLQVAQERIRRNGWTNVRTEYADAGAYDPPSRPVDAITFSYSLTMMPDWYQALEHAITLLRPGGLLGATDFYVARKWPATGRQRHSGWQRFFWPFWFSWDNVYLSPDHLPYLQSHLETVYLAERLGPMPYMFGLKAPYYVFVGRKR
jgi:S-adenosylmethionine-diacylgycerolhomoserine-N-methlytransferase